MTSPRAAFWLLMLALSLPLAASAGEGPRFNGKYSAPFGFRSDARVENSVRFSLDMGQGSSSQTYVNGTVKDKYERRTIGGLQVFALQLAMKDKVAFELSSNWSFATADLKRSSRATTTSSWKTVENTDDHSSNRVFVGLSPKGRFVDLGWFWFSGALPVMFPVVTDARNLKLYEVAPGFQFYFDSGAWFGAELDLQYLLNVSDKYTEITSKTYSDFEFKNKKHDRQVVNGFYSRVNFLLKLFATHFINVQVEDTVYFRKLSASREKTVRKMINHYVDNDGKVSEPKSARDHLDIQYYSNHQLNLGGGYRAQVGPFELGLGAWGALTQAERRQAWGLDGDLRVTF